MHVILLSIQSNLSFNKQPKLQFPALTGFLMLERKTIINDVKGMTYKIKENMVCPRTHTTTYSKCQKVSVAKKIIKIK